MIDKITLTLAGIRAQSPCESGWRKLLKSLGPDYGDDTPITFRQIYASNGYDDTMWCLRCVDDAHVPLVKHFALDCAEAVAHLMTDDRSKEAIKVARSYLAGKATLEALNAALAAALAAQMERWFKYCELGERPNE